MYKIKLPLLCIFPVFVLLSCAHQLAPGGGPADTDSPTVVSSVPSDGSLNVPTNSKIIFLFSEWISKKNPNVISIYPPLKHELKINKNQLQIIPKELLSDSQSYHVIISSALQDLHGNSFTITSPLVFSTGSHLDSGTISGCIVDSWGNNTHVKISLFRETTFKDSGYHGTPTYKFETDSLGKFNLDFIRKGNYRIVGNSMKSAAARLSDLESVYIPEDSIIPISNSPTTINLYPAYNDTAFPRISSIKAENKNYVVGTWNKFVDKSIFKSSIKLIRNDSSVVPITILPFGNPLQFALLPKEPFTVAPWKCAYSISRVFDTISFSDTILFNSTIISDTTKPILRLALPTEKMFFKQTIDLIWSEPVKINTFFYLFDSLGDTIQLQGTSGFNDTTRLTPTRSLKSGALYKLILLTQHGSDLSSNYLAPKDSTDTVSILKFSTIDYDSMGISLQGGSDCALPATYTKLKWLYVPFGKKHQFLSDKTSNTFSFDSIPAGKGRIGFFIDKNDNKVPDRGSLTPWRTPEPYYMYTDTVEVRARWEIEGLLLKGCPTCLESIQNVDK